MMEATFLQRVVLQMLRLMEIMGLYFDSYIGQWRKRYGSNMSILYTQTIPAFDESDAIINIGATYYTARPMTWTPKILVSC